MPISAKISDYFWNESVISEHFTDNQYFKILFYGKGAPYGDYNREYRYQKTNNKTRELTNDAGQKELTMILPYMDFYSAESSYEYFFLHSEFYNWAKTEGPVTLKYNTWIYVSGEPNDYVDKNGKKYSIYRINGPEQNSDSGSDKITTFWDNQVGLATNTVAGIDDLIGYHPFALPLDDDGNPRLIYNVIVKAKFNDDPDKPTMTSLEITYKTEPKARFIGTLAQTSSNYSDDGYGGWNTWVELEGDGYPYTYTFKPTETEYDLTVCIPNDKADNDYYPYLIAWNIPNEADLKATNIDSQLGVSKKFQLFDALGSETENAIHLSGLEPGKTYQLKIGAPFYETVDNDGEEEVYQRDSWITLMEYTPEINAYQLVEHTEELDNGNQVYYTYDVKKSGNTYKVVLGSDDEVLSCESIDLDESVAYKPASYLFTDKLFIRSEHPEWMMTNENIEAEIIGISGEFSLNERKYTFDTTTDNEKDHINKVITLTGIEGALSPQEFNIDGYQYLYQNHVETTVAYVIESDNEKKTESSEKTAESLQDSGIIQLISVIPVPTTPKKEYGYKSGDVIEIAPSIVTADNSIKVEGQLAVPTPASEEAEYTLLFERYADTDKYDAGNTVYLQFYDSELLETEEDIEQGFKELPYKLPSNLNIQAHDYYVTFPYLNPNVTDKLRAIVRNGTDDKVSDTKPYVQFEFLIENDNGELESTNIYSADDGTPGFYNANMGTIYDIIINQRKERGGDEAATRIMSVKAEYPTGTEYPIYDRWEDMTARITLDLNAPEVEIPIRQESDSDGKISTLNLYRNIRPINDGTGKWEEAIVLKGLSVTNNESTLSDELLESGDNDEEQTTLYLVELRDLRAEHNGEKTLLLRTKDELENLIFDIAVSEPFDYSEWDEENPKIDLTRLSGSVYPFSVRNVYLFPIENDGFNTDTEITISGSTESEKPSKLFESTPPAYEKVSYYAVTTPAAEPPINFETINTLPPVLTEIKGVTVSGNLAQISKGYVKILVEGANLYRADGTLIASGKGDYSVVPGVYIVRKERLIQKLIVR